MRHAIRLSHGNWIEQFKDIANIQFNDFEMKVRDGERQDVHTLAYLQAISEVGATAAAYMLSSTNDSVTRAAGKELSSLSGRAAFMLLSIGGVSAYLRELAEA